MSVSQAPVRPHADGPSSSGAMFWELCLCLCPKPLSGPLLMVLVAVEVLVLLSPYGLCKVSA